MAQLSDDCFAFSGPLLPVEEMERLIVKGVASVVETELIALGTALGRVLADDLSATIDLPPFANSAVDGYAVCHADLGAGEETRLRVSDRVLAGSAPSKSLARGEAFRVFTGAPMPDGADTVFMQEDCRFDDDCIILPPGLKRGANRRLAGEDIRAGSVAIPTGRRLQPPDVALAAALGLQTLTVRRRVRVALFSTGDEVVEPGEALAPAHIYDANRTLLATLLRGLGAQVTDLGILADDASVVRAALVQAAASHDLILTSGGVSTGEADHVRAAIEAIGRLVFWRIAIKPGRPVAMGVIPHEHGQESAAFLGLPGNPVAVFVTFVRVVRPLLLRLAGAQPEPLLAFPVTADFSYRKKKGRREYVRVSIVRAADGSLRASKHPQDGAGVLTSLTQTDGLGELADDITHVEPGTTIGFLPYASLFS